MKPPFLEEDINISLKFFSNDFLNFKINFLIFYVAEFLIFYLSKILDLRTIFKNNFKK